MSVYDKIRATFEVNLAAIPGIPPISWENVNFTPITSQSYLKVRMVPTLREPSVRGRNPPKLYRGYFLVKCCVPEGVGPSPADDLADTIIDAFDATTDITHSDTTLSIRYAERDLGAPEGGHFCVPVRIGWYLYQ